MKKILASLLAAMLLFLSGCGQSASASTSTEEPDEWGITLHADLVHPYGMTLICDQSGGKYKGELQTGAAFTLEREVEGTWMPVSLVVPDGDLVWTTEAKLIQPDGQTKWKIDWENIYGYIDPGSYRLSKEISDFRGPGKLTKKTYYVEFSVDM